MPKADAAWDKHTTAAHKVVEKEGGLTVKIQGWECNYCDGQFWNRVIYLFIYLFICFA